MKRSDQMDMRAWTLRDDRITHALNEFYCPEREKGGNIMSRWFKERFLSQLGKWTRIRKVMQNNNSHIMCTIKGRLDACSFVLSDCSTHGNSKRMESLISREGNLFSHLSPVVNVWSGLATKSSPLCCRTEISRLQEIIVTSLQQHV